MQEVEVKSVRLQALQDVLVHSSDSDDKLKSTQVRFSGLFFQSSSLFDFLRVFDVQRDRSIMTVQLMHIGTCT